MTILKAHLSPNLKLLYIRYIILPSKIVNITNNNIVVILFVFFFSIVANKKRMSSRSEGEHFG